MEEVKIFSGMAYVKIHVVKYPDKPDIVLTIQPIKKSAGERFALSITVDDIQNEINDAGQSLTSSFVWLKKNLAEKLNLKEVKGDEKS